MVKKNGPNGRLSHQKPLGSKNVNVVRNLKGAGKQDNQIKSSRVKVQKATHLHNGSLLEETLLHPLTGKQSATKNIDTQSKRTDNEMNKPLETEYKMSDDGTKTSIVNKLASNHPNSVQKIEDDRWLSTLSEENLLSLQREISQLEGMQFNCDHEFCHNLDSTLKKSDLNIGNFRVWFLFDLEMTADGLINLRNACYQKFIYNKVDIAWTKSNILKNTNSSKQLPCIQSDSLEFFPLEQISLRNIEIDLKNNSEDNRKNSNRLTDFSVNIVSMLESDEEEEVKHNHMIRNKKIAPTILSSRNKKRYLMLKL
ncbi:hypothetical protein TPHA_0E00790 [Tetrapisispora phaffii CBS 4417]|uniref:Uncharacterized protein n=1 Tax=Tetrapisispora phaffii (strain ATCC 24235 / CBS 4417 / NBRC 1672 / NRRL Y-8282 / UCD 70-5) TaxID=1071381 RepID=G8BTE6_TETPH|nr:hypothetical protein TPHA_0E00790 [Tetrapisispora phaffii CBS 4417]CCE63174.1 hypothetical protein TPHA_0E00790 [Tetrapisispora phaffii CBS 4417]